jgi:hypothetical protein
MPRQHILKLAARDLRHYVRILETSSDLGKAISSYTLRQCSWANIVPIENNHFLRLMPETPGLAPHMRLLYCVKMRYDKAITPGLFIEWDNKRAKIQRVADRSEQHRWLDIIAEETHYE